eukprot:CAMPEP_0173412554 /NCGR_PEP_ID=MMETSP1356-20130122/79785_1 /TAXON_ID=77927 ORGANISM="Hemiselmis virescens, Strain PCC157" /NCGR_SAMPLE_ID=MMETSP1356 /ASSEMBLY_ACC=CAM_ASM_000847 /LENGTH=132 /DNA_ID=CAMNT_0014374467 /DNA_START=115 /DNA_END=509 /DNA_ORIENTATION=-
MKSKTKPPPQTNFHFLSFNELQNSTNAIKAHYKQHRLRILNMERKVQTALKKLNNYKRLITALGEKDIPRLGVVVRGMLKSGCGVGSMLEKLKQAHEGTYRAKGWTSDDDDLAWMLLHLGGKRALYAANQKG